MPSFKTHIEIEVEVEVFYDYQPFEPQELNYPGCPAAIEGLTAWYKDFEISLNKGQLEYLEQEAMEKQYEQ